MTATEYPSLDALLANATPVEAEPFDLGALLMYRATNGVATNAGHDLARYVNGLRCTIDDHERVACNLEADAARTDQRIREALAYLGDALLWCEDRDMNVADCVSEAIAALKGDDDA